MNLLQNSTLDISTLESLMARPKLYQRSSDYIWTDDHVGKQMLEFHLNPDLDSASLKHTTIDQQVAWILERARAGTDARARTEARRGAETRLLDIGCGPGLYCRRFAAAGLSVVGMDFNRHSLEYARRQAAASGPAVEYRFGDYRALESNREFDVVTLINRDFGALTVDERDGLLLAVHGSLKPGGLFVFDTLSTEYYRGLSETQDIQVTNGESFWAARPHVVLSRTYLYPEAYAQLEQNVVIEEDGTTRHFRNWLSYYPEIEIEKALSRSGFEILERNPFLSDQVYDDPAKYHGFVCRNKA